MPSPAQPLPSASIQAALDLWEGRTAESLAEEWQVPRVVLLAEVGSTNDIARTMAADAAPQGTVVLAERQLAGRGRSGRSWASPSGLGLYLSLVARPAPAALSTYPLRVALAVARALDPWTAGSVKIKWPNDLLLAGRKFGGILCEATWAGTTLEHAIIGIGLNVLHEPEDFSPDLREKATSIRAAGAAVSRLEIATAVVRGLADLLSSDRIADLQLDNAQAAELNRRHAYQGEDVDLVEPDSGRVLLSGTAEQIASDGSLRVREGDVVHAVRSGTLRLSRARSD